MADQTSQAATDQKLAIIKNHINAVQGTFDNLNFTGLKFAKEAEFALQILAKSDYLQKANPDSIKNAIVNCALTGITLNPVLKLGYLIPRKMGSVLMCLLEPSYMGLCKILTDTGSVVTISASIVYEKEAHTLEILPGANGYARHTPYVGFDKPGKPVACYTKAVLPSGIEHIELLRVWEWEDIKKRSESVKSYDKKKREDPNGYAAEPTWVTDEVEMIRKTCLKKHYKYLPKTEQAERIAKAIDLDNQVNGIDFSSQNQSSTISNTNATPNAPKDEVMATGEDLEHVLNLIKNPALGDLVFGNISKDKMAVSVQKKYDEGLLSSEKATAYIDGLKAQIEALGGDVDWTPPVEGEHVDGESPATPADPPAPEEPAADDPVNTNPEIDFK